MVAKDEARRMAWPFHFGVDCVVVRRRGGERKAGWSNCIVGGRSWARFCRAVEAASELRGKNCRLEKRPVLMSLRFNLNRENIDILKLFGMSQRASQPISSLSNAVEVTHGSITDAGQL